MGAVLMTTQLNYAVPVMRYVPLIDATGCQSLKGIIKSYRAKGIQVILSGINEETKKDF
ncbi:MULTISPECIES: sodium-independent anion transporter [unclassified Arenibacter]|jgi:SulP family sulfate permease|uniref:sodium-independent anion transporter n=1 Tax=unclassified Arenibacter TaxID=2615047 RepID=UPI000E34996D|nr:MULTISPECIES: sodium-independent anion transporter [unclassified Arenibacter]MCM4162392.1 hypothetical protein [Arenibacter sp. A80]RFT57987.1 sodium-independent anion transporter [Arenibacter sp. P308M17]